MHREEKEHTYTQQDMAGERESKWMYIPDGMKSEEILIIPLRVPHDKAVPGNCTQISWKPGAFLICLDDTNYMRVCWMAGTCSIHDIVTSTRCSKTSEGC